MLVRSWPSCCELPNHPIGPAFGPVLDVWSFDETQHEHCMLHWVYHLFCIDVRQAVKVELIDEGVHKGTIPIEIRRRVSHQLPITSASTGASWWSSWWSSTTATSWGSGTSTSSRWADASATSWATSSGWSGSAWWFSSWSTLPRAGFIVE